MKIEYTKEQKQQITVALEESIGHWFGQCLTGRYPQNNEVTIFSNELRLGLGSRNLVEILFRVCDETNKFILGLVMYNKDVFGRGPEGSTRTFFIDGLNYQTVIADVVALLPDKE